MWPIIIFAVLQCVGLGIALQQHGTPKTGLHNAWGTVTAIVLSNALLYWGGWFDALFHQPPLPC